MRANRLYLLVAVASFSLIVLYLIISAGPNSGEDEYESEDRRWTHNDYRHAVDADQLAADGTDTRQDEIPEKVGSCRRNTSDVGASELALDNHLLDSIAASSREEEIDFDFSKCRMGNCFDFSRCRNSFDPLRIHIVESRRSANQTSGYTGNSSTVQMGESNIIHGHILDLIRNSIYFEPDAQKACMFVLEDDTLDRDPLSKSFRPDLGKLFTRRNLFGMNYLVFNLYSGTWPDYRANDFAGIQMGAAILAKASNSIDFHRPNYDIPLPLFSFQHPKTDDLLPNASLASGNTEEKSYFLTFKGKRYVFGSGSDTRNRLYHLNNQRDVILLTTCRHGKKWRESSDERCTEDETNYNQYEFTDLMRESTFCLVPRGRRLGSFRFLEAMSVSCIPVVLSDGWVKPFDELIDWSCASVQFGEDQLVLVPDALRDVSRQSVRDLSRNAKYLYDKHLSTMERILLTTISIIATRIRKHYGLDMNLD